MKPLYEADEHVKVLKPESMPSPKGDLVHIVHFFKPDANSQQVSLNQLLYLIFYL